MTRQEHAKRAILGFQRDIRSHEKEPQSEGRDLAISFCRTQIALWQEELK